MVHSVTSTLQPYKEERIMQTQRSTRRFLASVIAVAVLTVCASRKPAFAVDVLDDPAQIDERIGQLLQTSNSLCWEMFRYHQQQPDYANAYRSAKEIWSKAGQIQDTLRSGPMETEVLKQQTTEINVIATQLERTLSTWGPEDRSSLANSVARVQQRTAVAPGVGVDLPLIGVRVGGPQVVVTDEVVPQLQRHRLHPNSPGSKRSLEREVAAMRVSLNYLMEDAGLNVPSNEQAKGPTPDPTLVDPNSPTALPSVPKKE
jgi:hypothetical protein